MGALRRTIGFKAPDDGFRVEVSSSTTIPMAAIATESIEGVMDRYRRNDVRVSEPAPVYGYPAAGAGA